MPLSRIYKGGRFLCSPIQELFSLSLVFAMNIEHAANQWSGDLFILSLWHRGWKFFLCFPILWALIMMMWYNGDGDDDDDDDDDEFVLLSPFCSPWFMYMVRCSNITLTKNNARHFLVQKLPRYSDIPPQEVSTSIFTPLLYCHCIVSMWPCLVELIICSDSLCTNTNSCESENPSL